MLDNTDQVNPAYPWVRITKNPLSSLEKDPPALAELEEETPGEPGKKELNAFGVKITYARAFGVAFMVLFILLFFPGIGVSSSGVKKANDVPEHGKGSMDNTN